VVEGGDLVELVAQMNVLFLRKTSSLRWKMKWVFIPLMLKDPLNEIGAELSDLVKYLAF
jgi:hypothetical protein